MITHLSIASKRFLMIIIGIFWIVGMRDTNAAVVATNDCSLYANTDAQTYPGVVEKWLEERDLPALKFYTSKDLERAVLHHQMACCEEVLKDDREVCQSVKEQTEGCENCYPRSNYLFDHLINIGMRKFDGIQEHCDELDISCTMNTSSVKTLEWREKIDEIAEDEKGYPPSLIMEEFLEHRGGMSEEDILDPDTISNAYHELCQEAGNIINVIGINQAGTEPYRELCVKLIRQRYLQEYTYVRTLMVEKGVQYFIQNTHDYLQEYFIESRMNELVNKYARLDNCFTTVLRYATKTSCCNE